MSATPSYLSQTGDAGREPFPRPCHWRSPSSPAKISTLAPLAVSAISAVCAGGGDERCLVAAGENDDFAPQLAENLDGNLNLRVFRQRFVVLRPRFIGQRLGMAK